MSIIPLSARLAHASANARGGPVSRSDLRDLAIDSLGAVAATLRKANPTLSHEVPIAQAARTPEGRSSYEVHRQDFAKQPWPDAIRQILQRSRPTIKTTSRKATPAAGPADAIYSRIVEQALAAAPEGRSQSGAIADFLQTSAGQMLWRQYNAGASGRGRVTARPLMASSRPGKQPIVRSCLHSQRDGQA